MKGDSGHRAQGSVIPGKGHREERFWAQGTGKGDSGHGHSNGRFWAWDMGKGDSRHRAQQRLILVTGYREGRFFLPRLIFVPAKIPQII